jgi:hypothetical protein
VAGPQTRGPDGRERCSHRQEPPIKIPAASTIEPPSTIWNTAWVNGVLMYFERTKAIAQSSKNTTTPAMLVAIQNALFQASGTRYGSLLTLRLTRVAIFVQCLALVAGLGCSVRRCLHHSDNVARSPKSTSGLPAMPAGEMLANAANGRLESPTANQALS